MRIGELPVGLQRHRVLLFKALAPCIGIKCGGHLSLPLPFHMLSAPPERTLAGLKKRVALRLLTAAPRSHSLPGAA